MRKSIGVLLGVLAVLILSTPATAHVTVTSADRIESGEYARVEFRVPNEEASAATTQLEIVFDEAAPIAGARTLPIEGWEVSVERETLDTPLDVHGREISERVSKITWSATGEGIGEDEFGLFTVLMGPLPDVKELVFKAVQTYSDGSVVRWIDENHKAANPAPVLSMDSEEDAPFVSIGEKAGDAEETSSSARTMSFIALSVSGLALLAGAVLFFMQHRETSADENNTQ